MAENRCRLQAISRELFLSEFQIKNVDPWLMERLTTLVEEQTIRAGDVLYSAGAPADALYFMQQGRVSTTRKDGPSWTFDGRWLLGGFDVFVDHVRARTTVALEDFEALRIGAESWLDLVEDSFALARRVVTYSAAAVAGLEERLALTGSEARRTLPFPERALDTMERLAALTEFAFLRGAGVQVLVELSATAEEKWLEPGDVLDVRSGSHLWLVLDGEVEASREGSAVRRSFGALQTVLGVAAFAPIDGVPWEAHVARPSRVLRIPVEAWFDVMEVHFDLVRAHMSALARRRDILLDRLAESLGPAGLVLP